MDDEEELVVGRSERVGNASTPSDWPGGATGGFAVAEKAWGSLPELFRAALSRMEVGRKDSAALGHLFENERDMVAWRLSETTRERSARRR